MKTTKINIFTKKELESFFPGSKAIRTKSGWNILYPLSKDNKKFIELKYEHI